MKNNIIFIKIDVEGHEAKRFKWYGRTNIK